MKHRKSRLQGGKGVKKEGKLASLQVKAAKAMDIPINTLLDLPQIEMTGNREAVVEGCQGIVEYDETSIQLRTKYHILQFTGADLQIKTMTDTSVVVQGMIAGLSFQQG